jgi:AcrR family transcriptional regulator
MKQRIVDYTTGMFARDGVKAVRMDDIAAEMGMSKRTIYEMFGDKEALILACLDHFHNKLRIYNDELTRDADNIITEYLTVLDVWDKQMDATSRIMDDVRKFYPRVYDQYMMNHACMAAEEIRHKLQQGIEQGYLVPSLTIDIAMAIFGHSLYGAIKSGDWGGTAAGWREAFKFFTTHFLRGISTRKGIELIDKKLGI